MYVLVLWHLTGSMLPVHWFSQASFSQAFFPTTHSSSLPSLVPISQQVTLLTASFPHFVHVISRPLPGFSDLGGHSLLITFADKSVGRLSLSSLSRWPHCFGFVSCSDMSPTETSTLSSQTPACLPNSIESRMGISGLTCPNHILNFPSSLSSPCQCSLSSRAQDTWLHP